MEQTLNKPLLGISEKAVQESGLTPNQLDRLAGAGVVSAHPRVVSGAVVFTGTRVPVYNLWDYLNGGDSVDSFLDSFPTVRREQVEQSIQLTQGGVGKSEHSL